MATAAAIPSNVKWWSGGRSPFNASYGKVMMWYFLMSDAFTFGAFLISYGTIRFSQVSWPDPNVVFQSAPFIPSGAPLVFVSLMTFILIFSSVTMVLAVHEGHRMNRKGVEKYMWLTILGGLAFLACQAWEWTHLLTGKHPVLVKDALTGKMSIEAWAQTTTKNPWGPHIEDAKVLASAWENTSEKSMIDVLTNLHGGGVHFHEHDLLSKSKSELIELCKKHASHVRTPGAIAFGGYFYGITGFHGFHVFSGVVINIILLIKARLGHFDQRGHYEMIEKGGLYWHFVDLVWVFVFLCFYLV